MTGKRRITLVHRIGKETIMKLLLTSCGMSNDSIRHTLVALLGKPKDEGAGLVLPTTVYAYTGGAAIAYQLIHGEKEFFA